MLGRDIRRAGTMFKRGLGSRAVKALDKAAVAPWSKVTLILFVSDIQRLTRKPFGAFVVTFEPMYWRYVTEVQAAWTAAAPAMAAGTLRPKNVVKIMRLPNQRIVFGGRLIGLGRPPKNGVNHARRVAPHPQNQP
jgi:hypothetical protein